MKWIFLLAAILGIAGGILAVVLWMQFENTLYVSIRPVTQAIESAADTVDRQKLEGLRESIYEEVHSHCSHHTWLAVAVVLFNWTIAGFSIAGLALAERSERKDKNNAEPQPR